jgi:hypothetical protein
LAQAAFRDDVHGATEEAFELSAQSGEVEQTTAGLEPDEEVNIAVLILL